MALTIILRLLIVIVITIFTLSLKDSSIPGSDIQTPTNYELLKEGKFGSQLYRIVTSGSSYAEDPYLLNALAPTSYAQGFDAGYLLGNEFIVNYNSLLVALFGDEIWEPIAAEALGIFLDWQWNDYLSVQVPDDFKEELQGITAGARAAGELKHDVGKLTARGIVLANFPGTISNINLIIKEELSQMAKDNRKAPLSPSQIDWLMNLLKKRWAGLSCSMFGAWGSRTENGRLFSGRNLDWLADTGISMYKLITVHHPIKGYSHATIGWAGLWGAITGMSSKGITVHEANLESNDVTFLGFPWITRLRYIMANAANLEEATSLWLSTNNTEGYNHGIGSASDGEFICLETMKGNTAIFHDNDSREQDLVVDGQQIGQAREEAVFRTNHGYDPYTISHYMWNDTAAYQDSITRYMAFPEAFDSYQAAGKAITYVEAVNITAVLGSKGDNLYQCASPYVDAYNILSVAYDPSNLMLYAAWESGQGETWVPAACSTYLTIDMSTWFKRSA